MNRLLRVELRRLWARRLTWWALVGVLAVAAMTAFSAYGSARPPTETQLAEAEQMYQQELASWEESGDEQVAECKESEEADPDPAVDYGCDDMEPRLDWFLPPQPYFVPPAAEAPDLDTYAEERGLDGDDVDPRAAAINTSMWSDWGAGTQRIATSALAVVAIAFVLGVSFVTAETSSGALGLWLTFEPRRRRVFWSKAVAAGAGTIPLTVLGTVALIGAVYAVYAAFGTVGDLTAERWGEIAGFGGRLVVEATALAMIGAALGAIFRHAAAAIGVAAVLAWVGTLVTGAFDVAQAWNPVVNLGAWLNDGAVYNTQQCAPGESGIVDCVWVEKVVSQAQGGLYLLALTVVALIVAAVVFRRRDVS
ncbi:MULTISPECIES: ABC transporter permease subunit [unclassified Isoptericola]|uniref:ABC transporter permease subunit n=1 Tax=unclassified Isoptericola TaxID=2623355 RepID=UPI0036600AF6